MTILRRPSLAMACWTVGVERMDMDIWSVIFSRSSAEREVLWPAETAEEQPGRRGREEIAKSAKRTRRGTRRRDAALLLDRTSCDARVGTRDSMGGTPMLRGGRKSTGWKPVPRERG